MKIEITQKGVNVDGQELPVGTRLVIPSRDGEEPRVPGWLVGKCRVLGGEGPKVAVTNPAQGAIGPVDEDDEEDRLQHFIDAVDNLFDEDFTKSGLPKLPRVNEELAEGVESFTQQERDDLWSKIRHQYDED